ncbi:hypothetical protein [Actinacidiphila glaucinigra]
MTGTQVHRLRIGGGRCTAVEYVTTRTEDLVDSAVKVGLLMLAVAAVDRTRRWRHRRRAG